MDIRTMQKVSRSQNLEKTHDLPFVAAKSTPSFILIGLYTKSSFIMTVYDWGQCSHSQIFNSVVLKEVHNNCRIRLKNMLPYAASL